MPQDIPLEAADTLDFTPESLAHLEPAPVLMLRAATTRDKRFHRRLMLEEGLQHHDMDAIRAEVLAGLKAGWSPDAYAEHAPKVEAYWESTDDFALQKAADPDLEWSYDVDLEAAVTDLTKWVASSWKPLRQIIADNSDFAEMAFPVLAAVVVKDWTGLSVQPKRTRNYLTLDSIMEMVDALAALERANGLEEGTAWLQLGIACTNRMYLSETAAGNSDAGSQSETPPAASKTTSRDRGSSPATSTAAASPSSSATIPAGV